MKSYISRCPRSTDSVTEGLAQATESASRWRGDPQHTTGQDPRTASETRLDDVSKRIIEKLQQDGRRSYAAIGKAVGLSEAAVRQRVQRLVDAGVMQIVAVTDPMQLGFARQAMIGIRCTGDTDARSPTKLAAHRPRSTTWCSPPAPSTSSSRWSARTTTTCSTCSTPRSAPLPGVHIHRDLRLPETRQTAIQLGYTMTPTVRRRATPTAAGTLRRRPHATTCGATSPATRPRGRHRPPCRSSPAARASTSGTTSGNELHRRPRRACSSSRSATAASELAEAAAKQAETLAFFPLWSYAHPPAIELAERLADYAPGDLNRVFFTTGGGEAVETAWKLAKQYFKLTGKPEQAQGDLARRSPTTARRRARCRSPASRRSRRRSSRWCPAASGCPTPTSTARPSTCAHDEKAFGRWAADRIAEAIEFEGPDTVAAVFLEPVQNSGGCFPPPPGYFERVREICDEYDVLLVSDEVICAFGRIGSMFACDDFGYVPDIITCAKGMTSRLLADRRDDRQRPAVRAVQRRARRPSPHGYTFGGHPVSAAVALANLDIFEREGLNDHVKENGAGVPGHPGEAATTCRSSATSAATATSTASSWSRTRRPRRPSTTTSPSGCCAASSPRRCSTPGLYCRADDRGDPVDPARSAADHAARRSSTRSSDILRGVLTEAGNHL